MDNKNLVELTEILDIWENSRVNIESIDEKSTESLIDGINIIGRVSGECFFPGKTSRNKRFYSKKLWDIALSDKELIERLNTRSVYGTVGHEQKLDDSAILDGKVTHIVNKLWINENGVGFGEFLILGTPSGRNLYMILKAKGRVYFSTRSLGKYISVDEQGNKILAEDAFKLISIDFVLVPGFLDAIPSIVESNDVKDNNMSDNEMTKEFFEHLKIENISLKKERDELLKKLNENSLISESYKVLGDVKSLEKIKSEIDLYKAIGTIDSIQESFKKSKEFISKYSSLGSPQSIEEALNKAATSIEKLTKEKSLKTDIKENQKEIFDNYNQFFKKYGNLNDISEALNKTYEFVIEHGSLEDVSNKLTNLQKYTKKYGTLGNIEKQLTLFKEFLEENENSFDGICTLVNESKKFIAESGSFKDVTDVLKLTGEFIEENGTFDDINKVLLVTKNFVEVNGNFDEILETLDKSKKLLEKIEENEKIVGIKDLANKYSINEDLASKLVDYKIKEEDLNTLFNVNKVHVTSIKKSPVGASYLMGESFIKSDSTKESSYKKSTDSLAKRLMS